MRYAREWLDLGEMEMGIYRMDHKEKEATKHEYIHIDVFDVVKDHENRDIFFKKFMA